MRGSNFCLLSKKRAMKIADKDVQVPFNCILINSDQRVMDKIYRQSWE